jgi:D-alanine transaminase
MCIRDRPGIARETLIDLARARQIAVEERPFTHDEARKAAELFLTSTTAPILPVTTLDGAPVGDGRPGPKTRSLAACVWQEVARQTGWRHAPLSDPRAAA